MFYLILVRSTEQPVPKIEHILYLLEILMQVFSLKSTGWVRLIRSHTSARFSFELSGI